jgi:hypothetical protein
MGATAYFSHPTFWKHEMGVGHPECPERLGAIEDRLLISGLDMALQRREPRAASLGRHRIGARPHACGRFARFGGCFERRLGKLAARPIPHLDPDTMINAHTWDAALLCGRVRPSTRQMPCWPGSWKTLFVQCGPQDTTLAATRPWVFASSTMWRLPLNMRWSGMASKACRHRGL